MLTWDISFSGLIAPVTAAHFHGPAPMGMKAGLVIPIARPGATSPLTGMATINDVSGLTEKYAPARIRPSNGGNLLAMLLRRQIGGLWERGRSFLVGKRDR